MSLQVAHRPKLFKTFAGNKEVVSSLKSVVDRKDAPSAFLFVGPSGCGKTTLGRIVASKLGCAKGDFKEMNSADDRGIQAIRKLISDLSFAPLNGPKKVILLDEAHSLTKDAQEALLKVLEEPPPYVHFIICTTDPEKLKVTLKRRCHIYELKPLKSDDLYSLLKKILKKEKVKNYPALVLEKIIELSNGSPGQALKLLDMVIDFTDEKKAVSVLKTLGTTEDEVIDICRALCNLNIKADSRWAKIKKIIKNLPNDGESARRAILGYLEKVLLNNGGFEIALMMDELKHNVYDSGRSGLTLALFKAVYISEEDDE